MASLCLLTVTVWLGCKSRSRSKKTGVFCVKCVALWASEMFSLVLQAIFVLQQAPKAEWRSRLSQHATVTPLALG